MTLAARLTAPLVVLTLLCILTTDLLAQSRTPTRPFSVMVEGWSRDLDRARDYSRSALQTPERTESVRARVLAIRDEATAARDEASAEAASAQRLLDALGPPPAEEEPPEPDDVASNRAEFGERVQFYRARVAQAELTIARTGEILSTLTEMARAELLEELFTAHPLPLAPNTLRAAAPAIGERFAALARAPAEWWQALPSNQRSPALLWRAFVVLAAAAAIGWGIRRIVLARFGRTSVIEEPSYARRFVGAVAEGVARGVVPALIFAGLLWRAGSDAAVVSGLFQQMVVMFCAAMILLVLTTAMSRAILSPDWPDWRLAPIPPPKAVKLNRRVGLLAVIIAVGLFLNETTSEIAVSPAVDSVWEAFWSTIAAVGILLLMQPGLWGETVEPDGEDEAAEAPPPSEASRFWRGLRALIMLIAVAGILSCLVGYPMFGAYLIDNLLGTGIIIGVLFVLRGLLRELIGAALRASWVVRTLGIRHRTRLVLKFWFRALLDMLILAFGLIAVVPAWGVPIRDVWNWTTEFLRGFTIGNVTISLTDIAIAIAVFILAIVVTRVLQRALAEKLLPQTQIDVGVQNSLASGFGYLGVVLAIAIAVATVGIDLTNIALIAGALSVGIGFGLQNVVNNFVSGLILLIERPVKVGDWVVVGENEGFVKRISVRATELQTFQRASVIIPNADLLSNSVMNWTHKDRYGRIEIPVGVAYGSDTAQVREILLGVARAHDRVLSWPEPFVLFRDFGASSLDFELRCFTDDVIYRLVIGSDLRYEIDQKFRETGIEIPFPQRVVHMADSSQADTAIEGADIRRLQPAPTSYDVAAGDDST